jgi:hypothetical protein
VAIEEGTKRIADILMDYRENHLLDVNPLFSNSGSEVVHHVSALVLEII